MLEKLVIGLHGDFLDARGRVITLKGINMAGDAKLPANPFVPSQAPESEDFWDGDNASFVGSPFTLEEADEHFERIKNWGFNVVRYIFTWEALEHKGPGLYDEEFIEFTVKVLRKLASHDLYAFMDPHQDVWSRFSGGSGAPLWTFYAAGLNPRQFKITQSAILHNHYTSYTDTPEHMPKMIWSSNVHRLACHVMFTLFFGGKDFAPKCIIDGVNIQDYLQSHYIDAIKHFAQRIHSDPDLHPCVIGWESLNEPHNGLIGVEDITIIPPTQLVRLGTVPTPFQTMLLGDGRAQEVEIWTFTTMGPKKASPPSTVVDPHGESAWLTATQAVEWDKHYGWKRSTEWIMGQCVFRLHGVWDVDNRNNPYVKRPDYFAFTSRGNTVNHDTWVNEYFVHHWLDYCKAIRSVCSDCFLLIQPPVMAIPPNLVSKNNIVDPLTVYSPHFYDGLTLLLKKWNRIFNVDAIGIMRGKYPTPALGVRLGERAIRNSIRDQLKQIRLEGKQMLGSNVPCLITEIGIPYDMDDGLSFANGDYSMQIRAMDANCFALEAAGISHTLWTYVASNTHISGDNWNGEDLSLWSRDDLKRKANYSSPQKLVEPSSASSSSDSSFENVVPSDGPSTPSSSSNALLKRFPTRPRKSSSASSGSDNLEPRPKYVRGARAPEAFIRPYPFAVNGKIQSYSFDLQKAVFTLKINGVDKLDDHHRPVPTEIYIPLLHFPTGKTGVSTSSGTWKHIIEEQKVIWWHSRGPQQIQFKGKAIVSMDFIDTASSVLACRSL